MPPTTLTQHNRLCPSELLRLSVSCCQQAADAVRSRRCCHHCSCLPIAAYRLLPTDCSTTPSCTARQPHHMIMMCCRSGHTLLCALTPRDTTQGSLGLPAQYFAFFRHTVPFRLRGTQLAPRADCPLRCASGHPGMNVHCVVLVVPVCACEGSSSNH